MLTYEKALELKNAGFPMDYTRWEEHDQELLQKNWDIYEKVYVPTLSELIEACGGALESLENKIERKYKDGVLVSSDRLWKAYGIEMEPWNPRSNQAGKGSTPEEAVMNLWLELNKK